MLDAVERLVLEGRECCRFSDLILGHGSPQVVQGDVGAENAESLEIPSTATLNESQRIAVSSTKIGFMNLIWGPPGESSSTSLPVYLESLPWFNN
jgi:hypothetical protein